jgi:hypothetical protein
MINDKTNIKSNEIKGNTREDMKIQFFTLNNRFLYLKSNTIKYISKGVI